MHVSFSRIRARRGGPVPRSPASSARRSDRRRRRPAEPGEKVAGLKIKGGFPTNPRDTKLRQLAIAEGGQVNVYCL